MRDFKKEAIWDKEKYKRLTFKIDRKKYETLTPERQKRLSEIIRQQITDFLKADG